VPNDIPEVINGVSCPDHGELWTTPARLASVKANGLKLRGTLPLLGLSYEREMTLAREGPWLDSTYRLSNPTDQPRHFLWKLHAAST